MASSSNKRIARNAGFLYVRTLLVMIISLFTSRIALEALGVDDYGIYNVVGGVVAMLSFLNSAMAQATQRFLSFAQGRDDLGYQIKVFSTAIVVQITIAIIVLVLLETIGLWYLNNKVVLPPDRVFAARIVYQLSILTFLIRILVVPYVASVVANEHLHFHAVLSIVDALLLLVSLLVLRTLSFDKLIAFSIITTGIAAFYLVVYFIYSKIRFKECVFKNIKDWSLYKEMFQFAGWAFFGSFGFVARMQGVNLVINLFCGPAVNAARAVAYQVSSAIQTFVTSFLQAINPQITKRYAKGEVDSMMLLVRTGSKYTFLSLLICCTPVIVKSEYILNLWLGNAPEYASEFLLLALAMSLITSMGGTMNTAMQATGNIKLFQIVVTVIMCLDIPLSYLLLQKGVLPYLVTSVSIVTAFLCLIAKMLLLKRLIPYDIGPFVKEVVAKNFILAGVMVPLFFAIGHYIPSNIWGLLVVCLLSVVLYSICIYIFCMEKWEKSFVKSYLNKVVSKYIRKYE